MLGLHSKMTRTNTTDNAHEICQKCIDKRERERKGRQGQGKGRKDKPKMAEICGHAGKMFACFGQIN